MVVRLGENQKTTEKTTTISVLFIGLFLVLDIFPHAASFLLLFVAKILLILLATQYTFGNRYFMPLGLIFATVLIHPPRTATMVVAIINVSALLSLFALSNQYKININKLAYLMPVAAIGLISPLANTNTTAMNIYSLFFLKADNRWYWYVLVAVSLIFSRSEGALLATISGLLAVSGGFLGILLLIGGLLMVVIIKINAPGTVFIRLYLLAVAWFGFVDAPFFGQGWGAYEVYRGIRYVQPHNLILDFAYSGGLFWIIALFVGLFWLYKHKTALKPYRGFMIAFLVHSLVDAPYFGLPGFIFALVLGQILREKR